MAPKIIIPENTILVILGASGDLARKKLFPALFGLEKRCLLPHDMKIIGFAPDEMSHDEFIKIIRTPIKLESPRYAVQLDQFCERCSYVSGHEGGDESFRALQKRLEEIGLHKKEQNRLFYFSLPPKIFVPMSEGLKKFCYSKRGISRIIIEKPFGHDLESSRELQKALDLNWGEDEIFRVDHYLGKEVVNNLLVLRFGNEIFGGIWSHNHIDSVQISMAEGGGAEGRGSYYESTGVIRDVMQNHMVQILAMLTMERPKSFVADDLRREKVRVLETITAIKNVETIIGQYSKSSDGEKPAFTDEEDVSQDSRCATFCAAVARIENERWTGVPFLLKAGKALQQSKTEIIIQFKPSTNANIFSSSSSQPPKAGTTALLPNRMTIRVQPDEGVFLTVNSAVPSLELRIAPIDLDLTFRDVQIPEAYEVLLLDALVGDFSRSVRGDELDESWRVFTPLLHHLDGGEGGVPRGYPYGSTGPEGLDEFMESFQHKR